MKIGIYFDSRHIEKWNWQEFLAGELGLSGTDSQTLSLTYHLAQNNWELFLFSQSPPSLNLLKSIAVEDLNHALILAKNENLDLLIFCSSIGKEQIIAGIHQAEKIQQTCIFWCHNNPDPKITKLLAESKSIARVICVSATQADGFRDKPIFNKIEYIYNAIDPELFDFQNTIKRNPYQVCYLGSLTPAKGFQHLAKAWHKVKTNIPEATLMVLGSAKLYNRNSKLGNLGIAEEDFENTQIIPYLGSTKEEAKSKGVKFCGLVSPQEVRKIIATSSIGICNPNCQGSLETFCVSAVEIQATGLPVIAANKGGLKETVKNGKTGILINQENDLSTAIINFLNNQPKITLMGKNAKIYIKEKFRRELIVNDWLLLIQRVINKEKPNPPKFSFERGNLKVIIKEIIRIIGKIT